MWDQCVEFVQNQLQNNDLFQGGLLLMVGGAILALVRSWPFRFWGFIKYHSMVVIDIPDRDRSFKWVDRWLSNHSYALKHARVLTVDTKGSHRPRLLSRTHIMFTPAPGTHWLFYKYRLIILSRSRKIQENGDSDDAYREAFTIRVLGRDRAIVRELLEEARDTFKPESQNNMVVYTRGLGYWDDYYVPTRSMESVILPEGQSEMLIQDMTSFLSSEVWYREKGVPYHRGYLFHGPPGSGKTSFLLALATHLERDIALVNLKSTDLADGGLATALTEVPRNTILLIEDVDCVVPTREGRSTEGISFAGLLNALDGLTTPHGQIVFMTTNHREKLDPALIRPGRCDTEVLFTHATNFQKEMMFTRFFPDSPLASKFAQVADGNISMAEIQKYMMLYTDSPQAALENTNQLRRVQDETEAKTPEE